MSKLGVIIVAAGKGSRMRTEVSKQFLLLRGKQVLLHTLEVFQALKEVDEIVLVVGAGDINACRELIMQEQLSKVTFIIEGGQERQSSVYKGLQALSKGIEWVMVHDGVRPFVTADRIRQLYAETKEMGAAVLAVPVKETIKYVDHHHRIESTPERSKLWSIQTPQTFKRSLLLEAHEKALHENFLGTDDSMLVERMGIAVKAVEGDYTNIKITTPDDLLWAEYILKEREND